MRILEVQFETQVFANRVPEVILRKHAVRMNALFAEVVRGIAFAHDRATPAAGAGLGENLPGRRTGEESPGPARRLPGELALSARWHISFGPTETLFRRPSPLDTPGTVERATTRRNQGESAKPFAEGKHRGKKVQGCLVNYKCPPDGPAQPEGPARYQTPRREAWRR